MGYAFVRASPRGRFQAESSHLPCNGRQGVPFWFDVLPHPVYVDEGGKFRVAAAVAAAAAQTPAANAKLVVPTATPAAAGGQKAAAAAAPTAAAVTAAAGRALRGPGAGSVSEEGRPAAGGGDGK